MSNADSPRQEPRIGFLDRRRTVAAPGFNRWLIPPAALAIHLCIGEVYAFSVFKLPLARHIGIARSDPGDWEQSWIAWTFSLAIVFLGLSAAVFGTWLERVGPRKAMFASACCFGSGFLVAAVGVVTHQLWLLYLGYGVLGGIGLGLGYISPVSTLIKWFPDRPGMATGMAIMGFGGGAMIGSPLSYVLMDQFRSETSTGVVPTFVTLGVIYFAFMMFGVITVRVPPPGWKPAGHVKHPSAPAGADTTARDAIHTPQFWLLWAVLFLNVSAGIGLLEHASPMIQEMFPGLVTEAAAVGFVGLLSLFNMAGRIGWSSLSDRIGRKPTYALFFALGAVLYALIPTTGHLGSAALFVAVTALIMTMYGGGFATIPAYLRDNFGTVQVGAIHGRLLTAWSLAGIAGPVLVNEIRKYQIDHDVPPAESYTLTMYLIAAMLAVGFVCNALVRPPKRPAPPPAGKKVEEAPPAPALGAESAAADPLTLAFRWAWVGVPFAWGVWNTVEKSLALFR